MKRALAACACACAFALVAACERAPSEPPPAPTPPTFGIELADLASGFVPADGETPTVIVSRTAITWDGSPVVAVKDGGVDPAEVEGGAVGMRIQKLAAAAARHTTGALVIAFDKHTPYQLALQVMFSTKRAKKFRLLARTADRIVAAPIELPDSADELRADSLRLVVSLTAGRMRLWSFIGVEGTLDKPLVDTADLAALAGALAAVMTRHAGARQITVQADRTVPMQDVLAVIATARGAHFTGVQFSSGSL